MHHKTDLEPKQPRCGLTHILYTNNYSKLTDNYHYEQICYCCNIPHYIDNYEGNGKELSEVEMEELETALKAESVVREYPTEINAGV